MPHARQQAFSRSFDCALAYAHASLRMTDVQLFAARLTLMPIRIVFPNKVYLMLTAGCCCQCTLTGQAESRRRWKSLEPQAPGPLFTFVTSKESAGNGGDVPLLVYGAVGVH